MVVLNFEENWTAITAHVKNYVSQFGYSENIVSDGVPDDKFVKTPPFIKIFAIPSPDSDNDVINNFAIMRFTIFVAGQSAQDTKSAICNSVHLATIIRNSLLENTHLTKDSLTGSKIEPEALYNNYSLMSFELLSPYLEAV